ncbi:MAG: xanthine dehydrogenase family protein, partial [Alphaproteobacteria bacterium]|nr:xanthine dehydrogenase family protein [Alphaproteobacteria bacterium]
MSAIGAPIRRREDYRFLTGQGTYTDDINRPGQTYAYILRSQHAFARLNSIDTLAAEAADGVVAVFTGKDIEAAGLGGLPCGWLINNKDGSPMVEPPHPVIAIGHVRHVGDPVAVVIAESLGQARDAAELIEVDYGVESAVVDGAAAIKPGAPQIHEQAPGNVCYDWQIGELAPVEAALGKSARVVKLDLTNNRLVPNAMEPRAAIGEFNRATGEYTLYTTSQNPHVIRLLMGAFVLHIPEARLRVVAPDVGGGFGSKIYHYAEEAIVTWAAGKIRRPVKWNSDRSEAFMSDAHGRDHVTHVELGVDAANKFTALKVSTIANMGAYLSTFSTCIPTYLYATLLAGTYTTPVIYCETKAVFTNTVPVDAYRGAGRPEATFLLERIVDLAADELGVDPGELRRANFIAQDAFPYQTPVALQYDSGDYQTTLKMAQDTIDYAGFEARRQEAASRGKLRGLGIATYIEACGIAPSAVVGSLGARAGLFESASVRVHPTGSVTVLTGSHAHGQGHETTFSQLVSDQLGIPLEQIEIVHGDSGKIPYGMGTYGSRSLAVGGTAIVKAMDKVIAKGRKIAAHLMEAAEADVEFKDGKFTVAGTDRSTSLAEVALTAYVPHNFPHEELEPGLDETAFYDPKNFTFPSGAHIAEVEIEPDTGELTIVSFVAADDFGRIINPMIVEG